MDSQTILNLFPPSNIFWVVSDCCSLVRLYFNFEGLQGIPGFTDTRQTRDVFENSTWGLVGLCWKWFMDILHRYWRLNFYPAKARSIFSIRFLLQVTTIFPCKTLKRTKVWIFECVGTVCAINMAFPQVLWSCTHKLNLDFNTISGVRTIKT